MYERFHNKHIGGFAAALISLLSLLTFWAPPLSVFGQMSVSDRQAELQRELAQLESQIDVQRNILAAKRQESVSLERDIAILDAEIKRATLSIKARTIVITGLSDNIGVKNNVIGALDQKTEREQESLAQLIRQANEIDSTSIVEVVLSNKDLSQFFSDINSFDSIKAAMQESFAAIKDNKTKTQAEKDALEEKKAEQVQLQSLQVLEERRSEEQQVQKKNILSISRGIESVYEKIIVSGEQNAAKIRTELFTLQGSAAIPFSKALEYAAAASKRTGVRTALILGIIAEESNLGENVGTGNWRTDMKNPRDTTPFQQICSRLGLDPDKMPVSAKAWYGFGGAMGPAQFLPSTWAQFEDRIARATNHNPPNPWNPGDAIMASAILLMDNGADTQTPTAERLAALRYLAGWTNAKKSAYAFYGDDVMDLAAKYQQQINVLASN